MAMGVKSNPASPRVAKYSRVQTCTPPPPGARWPFSWRNSAGMRSLSPTMALRRTAGAGRMPPGPRESHGEANLNEYAVLGALLIPDLRITLRAERVERLKEGTNPNR